MNITIIIHDALKCPEDTIFTDIWSMEMDYAVWIYNRIPDMNPGMFSIEIYSRSRFELVPETLSNFHVWGRPRYILGPKL